MILSLERQKNTKGVGWKNIMLKKKHKLKKKVTKKSESKK